MSEDQKTADRRQIAEDLAIEIHRCEQSIDAAYAQVASFLSRLTAYQMEGRVAPSATQKAFVAFTHSAGTLIEARGHFVQGHNSLEAMRRVFGVRLDAAGAPDKPPADGSSGSGFDGPYNPDMRLMRAEA